MNRVVSFGQDIVKVGKMPTLHLPIADETVSRMHCVIERTENAFTVIDLGSTSGTSVNDERVNKASLKRGDVIRIGAFRLVVL